MTQATDRGAALAAIPAPPERNRYRRDLSPRLSGVSDVGRVRRQNEDAFAFSSDEEIWVVADGMGGHDFGDVASAVAVETVLGFLDDPDRWRGLMEVSGPGGVLLQSIHLAHERLRAEMDADPLRRPIGTTLLVAWRLGDVLHTCHVGDSRAYVFAGEILQQLTRDHSVVEMLLRTGQITASQVRFHPRRNQLTQAVGLSSHVGPTLAEATLSAGDRVLLCSDGLWGPLSEADLAQHLRSRESVAEVATRLVAAANQCGGNDNITVVLYEHDPARSGEG